MMKRMTACVACLLTVAMLSVATADDGEGLLIKNASFVNPSDSSRTETLNLLIKQGNLSLVTTDRVSESSVDQVVDAKGGIILGRLDIGAPASFMIIDEDPRINFDALLDTRQHAVLVLKRGEIVVNKLTSTPEPADGVAIDIPDQPRPWFAYAAPPIALATSYQNVKRWNHYKTKPAYINLIGAIALDRMSWVSQDSASQRQVGDLSDYNAGEIRALRFGAYGTLNFEEPWIYTFAAATAAFDKGFDYEDDDKIGIFDLRVDIPFYAETTLSIGKQKEPISMERLSGMIYLPMQERTGVADSMLPSRNIGIALSGTGLDKRYAWAAGVFNPWLDQETAFDEAATQIIGRGTAVPLANTDRSSLLHLGLGLRYTNAKADLAYQSTPEFNISPNFVSTGKFEAEHGMLYDLEAAWRWGPFLLNGEYVINQVSSETALDPTFSGYHITASYVLSGEMRPYNDRSGVFLPVPVAQGVNHGGWGAWEVSARYSNVDLTDGAIEGGEMDIVSLGINWWLSPVASFGINYRHIELESDDEIGSSDGIMTRLCLLLE